MVMNVGFLSAREKFLYDDQVCNTGCSLTVARPLWAVTHPDHWTIAEVGQWVEHVADEYHLSSEVKVALADAFVDVDGKRLMAMTLQDYRQRHEEYGAVLFYVYRRLTCKGE
ncbi:hypothetical protein C0Q70_04427 [Pomacea canaliculata]|uniref:PNT domain-containing protein n=1 Tax=Pomacea canaliculata TaxID=400727 RepID=A0A2T7PIC9_POMCA|nr:hypothetical protein C0Q70_04427 [Pomacea canaliculata]